MADSLIQTTASLDICDEITADIEEDVWRQFRLNFDRSYLDYPPISSN